MARNYAPTSYLDLFGAGRRIPGNKNERITMPRAARGDREAATGFTEDGRYVGHQAPEATGWTMTDTTRSSYTVGSGDGTEGRQMQMPVWTKNPDPVKAEERREERREEPVAQAPAAAPPSPTPPPALTKPFDPRDYAAADQSANVGEEEKVSYLDGYLTDMTKNSQASAYEEFKKSIDVVNPPVPVGSGTTAAQPAASTDKEWDNLASEYGYGDVGSVWPTSDSTSSGDRYAGSDWFKKRMSDLGSSFYSLGGVS